MHLKEILSLIQSASVQESIVVKHGLYNGKLKLLHLGHLFIHDLGVRGGSVAYNTPALHT